MRPNAHLTGLTTGPANPSPARGRGHVVILAPLLPELPLLAALHRQGFHVTLVTAVGDEDLWLDRMRPGLAVVGLTGGGDAFRFVDALRARGIPWLAWDMDGDPDRARTAYRAGALAVLPPGPEVETFVRLVGNTLAALQTPESVAASRWQVYRARERIRLPEDTVLEIETGVVAAVATDADGADVLLGLFGAGQVVAGHPVEGCHVEFLAHTDVSGRVRPWEQARWNPAVMEGLRTRLRQGEAWAAMRGWPSAEKRVLRVLELLAGQFGRPHSRGRLIDVRVTQSQLASAVGATRSTVARILGRLRRHGLVQTVATPQGTRFCLCGTGSFDQETVQPRSGAAIGGSVEGP